MKNNKQYVAPEMETVCVEAEVIRTSSPITNGTEGKVGTPNIYDFGIFQ